MKASERFSLGITILAAILCGVAFISLLCGCSNTGVRVVASSATYTNIGDINWEEYKIPVLSIYMGPKATVWVNKDYAQVTDIQIDGFVTNKTAALAIYDSSENKYIGMKVHFTPGETNLVEKTALKGD